MAEDWTAEALDIYNEFVDEGFAFVVRTPGDPGTFNPVTLVYDGAASPDDSNTYGLKKNYRTDQVDGTIVKVGDVILLVPAYGLGRVSPSNQIIIPKTGWDESYGDDWDQAFDEGWDGELEIISVRTIDPGNVALLYECQVRVMM